MRRLGLFLLFIALPLAALAQDEGGGIDVIDVSGPLDASALAFMVDSIGEAADSGQELIVLQVNSKAVLDTDEFERLSGLVESPPLPLAVWVGPAPAAAFGGIGEVVLTAQEAAIAPGSTIGLPRPSVLGVDDSRSDEVFDAEDTGLELQPTLRQYLQDLDGRTVDTASGPVTLSTIRDFEGGVTVKQVTFNGNVYGVADGTTFTCFYRKDLLAASAALAGTLLWLRGGSPWWLVVCYAASVLAKPS